jgi:hypothetical protein
MLMTGDLSKWSPKEVYDFVFLLSLACVAAYFIVKFLSFVQTVWSKRQPGDGFLELIQGVRLERTLRKQARETMFGDKALYLASYPLNLVVLWFYVNSMQEHSILYTLFNVYFLTGIAVTILMRFKDAAQWNKLNVSDKGYFYIVHAWYWPWPLMKRLRGDGKR